MFVSAETRESTASVTREHKLLGGNRGNLCDEEEEPATERRRKYTDLGLDLGER